MSFVHRALITLPLVLGLPSVAFAGHRPPPPPHRVEYVAPRVGHHWVSGHWDFRGAWVWVPGHYARVAPVAVAPRIVIRL
jgi:hypothetical protein